MNKREADEVLEDYFPDLPEGDHRLLLPPPMTPLPAARAIVSQRYSDESGNSLLRWHQGDWYRHTGTHWGKRAEDDIIGELYSITERAAFSVGNDEETGREILRSWNPTERRVKTLVHALSRGVVGLDSSVQTDIWISGDGPRNLLPAANGLLDRETRELHPHSPDYFNIWSLPYAYDPDAPPPVHFLEFLGEIFPGDQASQDRLLELFGLYVSDDMSFQKIGAFLGAKRSGKGTCIRVLKALLGEQNVATVTLSGLASQFGMAGLIGRPLAVIPDSRYNGRDADTVVSRLLMISGEDYPDVPRKNRPDWQGKLPTRLLLASNLLPKLRDESGVIASRFVTLYYGQDFTGREDRGLTDRLLSELPGILNLALDGLDRLQKQGHFTVTANAEDDLEEMEVAASPEKGFVRDCCEIGGPELQASKEELHARYKVWCAQMSYRDVHDLPAFMRALKGAFPSIDTGYRLPRQPDGTRPRGPVRGIRLRGGGL